MNYYIDGQTVRFRILLTDPATPGCDPDDPTTQDPVDDPTLVLTLYKPDGTTQDYAVVRESTGTYHADVTVDQTGQWEAVSLATGAAANKGRDRVYVAPVP